MWNRHCHFCQLLISTDSASIRVWSLFLCLLRDRNSSFFKHNQSLSLILFLVSWGNSRLLYLSCKHAIVPLGVLSLLINRLLHKECTSLWMKPNRCLNRNILPTICIHYYLMPLILFELLLSTLVVDKKCLRNGSSAWRRQISFKLDGNQRLLRNEGWLIGKHHVWYANWEFGRWLLEGLGYCHCLSLHFVLSEQFLVPHLRLSLSLLDQLSICVIQRGICCRSCSINDVSWSTNLNESSWPWVDVSSIIALLNTTAASS